MTETYLNSQLVTVLMSVYNDERYLSEAIESMLCQSFGDFEFLIINDGSTDGSRDILGSYDDPRIRLIDIPENIGLTRALNRGLRLAKGALIARCFAGSRIQISPLCARYFVGQWIGNHLTPNISIAAIL